ncbi:MAG: Stearoyl-CoA 9-desaturase [Fibrobacteres bacterium]|nr:Stearoyl-CoA 9-desaturase [Fibrobacterota bacterium]
MIAHQDSLTPFLIKVSRKQKRISFWVIHAVCLGAIWTGVSPVAALVGLAFYLVRMFAITGWYHRYFSHRSFKTGRATQFVFACLGCMACQKGPLWWASHHREHHMFSDGPRDPHSPVRMGFWYSHVLWFFNPSSYAVREERIRDLLAYPELRWLERYHWVPPLIAGACMCVLGYFLQAWRPALGTGAMQMLVWGFFVSTVMVYHGTFSINSLGHLMGRARYETGDESRNSPLLALFTLGEGWHNNHHHFPASARQGFFWWEVDITFYLLKAMAMAGLVRELRRVPERVRDSKKLPKWKAGSRLAHGMVF